MVCAFVYANPEDRFSRGEGTYYIAEQRRLRRTFVYRRSLIRAFAAEILLKMKTYCGRPWPAAYINIIQNTHQIQVLT